MIPDRSNDLMHAREVEYASVAKRKRSWKRKLLRLVCIAGAPYVLVCAAVWLFQGYLLYFPTRLEAYEMTPADIGLPFEDVRLITSDGVSIASWYVSAEPGIGDAAREHSLALPADNPSGRGTVIFCHGNAGTMQDRLLMLQFFQRLGFNVLMFDYRGFGTSEGAPSEQGTYLDAEAAWQFVSKQRRESPARILLYGRSLGGGVAVELATRHEPKLLVLESTLTSVADVGAQHYRLLPVRLLVRYRYDSLVKIGDIPCPKLIYHGRGDELIAFDLGRRLADAAAEPKTFLPTPGGHNDAGILYNDQTASQFESMIEQYFPSRQ